MTRPVATPNPHLAIDRLVTLRREMAALVAREETMTRRVCLLPDGRHEGIASVVHLSTGPDGLRRCVVVADALADGPPQDPRGDIVIAPVQMA